LELNFNTHIANICKKASRQLNILKRIGKYLTKLGNPECIANLKLPIDAFYRESRSGVNIAKRNITTGLFRLPEIERTALRILGK
jgi:hypothetical protein